MAHNIPLYAICAFTLLFLLFYVMMIFGKSYLHNLHIYSRKSFASLLFNNFLILCRSNIHKLAQNKTYLYY